MKIKLTLFFCLQFTLLWAQNPTQTIRGKVVDVDTKEPLIGVNVAVYMNNELISGAATDENGLYRIPNIAVGRIQLVCSYLGYQTSALNNVVVGSAKEVVIDFELELSAAKLNEIEVKAHKEGEIINEMAVNSATTFTVENTERFAGSRGDPARMATNFAGVAGTDDSRNDIVVRGNSPFGIMYRLEDVSIPNPSHFAVAGSTGGPVGMLNNKTLSNSLFLTGAFPAEYGNAMSGVFDINMKKGNDEQHELTGQFGLLGLEAFAEGPISRKNHSSYMFNYRYAVLDILIALGVDVGTEAIPKYQDLQFKLNFPLKNDDNISVFGLGGYSNIKLTTSDDKEPAEREIYSTKNTDEWFRSGLGVIGATYSKRLNNNSFMKSSFALSTSWTKNHFDRILRHVDSVENIYVVDSIFPKLDYEFIETKISNNTTFNTRINSRNAIRAGLVSDFYNFNFVDSTYNEYSSTWLSRLDYKGYHLLLQPFAQWKFTYSDKLNFVLGAHLQWFSLNNSWAIEPRAGVSWKFKPNQSLSFSTGLHSQMQPSYIYFTKKYLSDGSFVLNNADLGFTRAYHAVLGYDLFLKHDMRIKAEAYVQYLFDIPIEAKSSSYSILNEGAGFDRFFPSDLVNKGIGRNYGLELTYEKFFTHNWFLMFSGSVFDAKYRASDGVWYNSDFNSRFILNLLGTKEFVWGKKRKNIIGVGGKLTYGGGRRYSPYDLEASKYSEDPIIIDNQRNSLQFKNYFRLDIKLNYKVNSGKNITHEVGVDLVNVTFQKNLLRLQYTGDENQPTAEVYQLGFMPLFYYRIDFSIKPKNKEESK